MVPGVATAESPFAFDFSLPACVGTQLDEIFAKPFAQVSKWRKDRVQAAQLEAEQGLQELWRERAHLEELQEDLESALRETQEALQQRTEGECMAERLRHSIKAAATRAEVVAETKDKLCQAHEVCLQKLQQEERALAEQRQAAEAQAAEIECFLRTYAERLGLIIVREGPQRVRMAFTHIDDRDLSREFSFSLGIRDSSGPPGYCVDDCCPRIPELDTLLERLNENMALRSALPSFACGMRRAFQGLVARAA